MTPFVCSIEKAIIRITNPKITIRWVGADRTLADVTVWPSRLARLLRCSVICTDPARLYAGNTWVWDYQPAWPVPSRIARHLDKCRTHDKVTP